MRRFSQLPIVLLCALVAGPTLAQDAVHWHNDLESAKTMAKSTNRLVLIHFWAPSCGPCMALERNVFNQPGVASAIEQQYVPVKLNADENSATAQLYGITRIPTDVITTPDGQIVSKMISPPTPAAYIAEVTSAAGKYASKAGQAYANAASAAPAPSQMNSAYARLAVSPTMPTATAPADTSIAQDRTSLATTGTSPSALVNGSQTPMPRLSNSTPNFPSVPAATSPIQSAGPSMGPAAVPAMPVAQVTPSPQPNYGAASATPAAPQVIANPAVANNQPSRSTITPIGSPTYQPAPAAPTLNAATTPSQTTNPYVASAGAATANQPTFNPPPMTPAQPVAAAPQWPSVYSPQSQPQAAAPSQGNPTAPPIAGIAPTANAPQSGAATAAATNGSVPDPRLLPPGAPPLAFEGYCPVTMRNTWKWVPGNPQYGIVHLGRTYWFAGAEEQKQFWTDPARYAPALSGNDPVLAIDHQQQVAGKREHSLDYDGLFYMFASEATLQQFAANPAKYAASVRQAMGLPRGRLVR